MYILLNKQRRHAIGVIDNCYTTEFILSIRQVLSSNEVIECARIDDETSTVYARYEEQYRYSYLSGILDGWLLAKKGN